MTKEQQDTYDEDRFLVGNYFRTKEEAKQAVKVVREYLMKIHEKNK